MWASLVSLVLFSLSKANPVVQNKDKPKKGHLPKDMMDEGRYYAAVTTEDVWICYPWEATYVLSILFIQWKC